MQQPASDDDDDDIEWAIIWGRDSIGISSSWAGCRVQL